MVNSFKELFDILGTSDLEEIKKIKGVTVLPDCVRVPTGEKIYYIKDVAIRYGYLVLYDNTLNRLDKVMKHTVIFGQLGS